MQRKFFALRRAFGYTAYTWGNSGTNGWEGSAKIQPIESLRGQVGSIEIAPKHAAIITSEGELYTWGDSNHGKLGLAVADGKPVKTPTLVPFFTKNNIKVKSVALGKNHTLVLDTKGRLFSFGKGSFSNNFLVNLFFAKYVALGHPKAEHIYVPKIIEKVRNVPMEQVSTGRHFGLSLSREGDVYVWGRGEFGVLGCGNAEVAEPMVNELIRNQCAENGSKVVKIDSCSDFSSVLFSDGTVRSFGNNDQGNMGIGSNLGVDFCEAINVPTPMEFVGQQKKVIDIDLAEFTTALKTDSGEVYMCGLKLYFQPELLALDYDKHRVSTFGACDRGVAVVTEENRLFSKGNFWINEGFDEDVNTGVSEILADKYFHGKRIAKIGGKYVGRYALIKDD
jgi:alpha-tubulin suppressor-like RCC1 family protein